MNTTVTRNGTTFDITGGARPSNGANLFHSFSEFGVPTNHVANFLNDSGLATSNILGRVTGGNPSNIFGTIQTTGFGGANLFVMNPAGIVFGPNASLNVGGSVNFTTADYLRLADGGKFTALPGLQDAAISSAPVAAFGFLGSNPAAITVQGGMLSVQPGQSLSLVGGNQGFNYTNPDTGDPSAVPNGIMVTGAKLSAPSGQIKLASVASPAEILTGDLTQAPIFNGQPVGALGAIEISQKSIIDVSGNGLGTIAIRGGSFVMNDSALSANNASPPAGPSTATIGGTVIISASSVRLENGSLIQANAANAGSAGTITIQGVDGNGSAAASISMNNATVTAIASGGSPSSIPGAITITADTLTLANGTSIRSDTYGAAPAGNIAFNVDTLTSNAGSGRVLLNPPIDDDTVNGNVITSSSRSVDTGAGPAGSITIQGAGGPGTSAKNVTLKDTSLNTNIFGGSAMTSPSAITITADSLLLTNEVYPNDEGGAATLFTTSLGAAPAGNIALQVNSLRVNVNPDGTPIADAHRVYINSPGSGFGTTGGPAGTITISGIGSQPTTHANLIALNNVSLSTAVEGGTAALAPGLITMTADTITLTGATGIFAFTSSAAPAGNITLHTNNLLANVTSDGSFINGQPQSFISSLSISPDSSGGRAGTVTISGLGPGSTVPAKLIAINNTEISTVITTGTAATTPASITLTADTLSLTNSKNIKTDTSGGAPAGNLAFSVNQLIADHGTKISSRTSGTGPGGKIAIEAARSVTLGDNSSVTASSTGSGNAGNIVIQAGSQFVAQNASITTEAIQASGGNIVIQATDSIRLINSRLSTSVNGGPNTAGGNITLDPTVVTLQNSQITAQAVQGAGGNINIIAGTFLADQTSIVSASSQFGLSGSVNIQSPVSSLSNTLAILPQRPLQAQNLLRQRCAAQAEGHMSSLVIAGRDTLPLEPGGWLMSSPAMMAGAEPTSPVHLAADEVFETTRSIEAPVQRWSEQLNGSSQRDGTGLATGCGS
ncbi:MAG: filamentous hemagglutinin N-terminal domain-containing protein [Nitrospira sp.]|nr:filamentous hemagglutinin N-terminal domain-containing protein [Nitrospira sp.]